MKRGVTRANSTVSTTICARDSSTTTIAIHAKRAIAAVLSTVNTAPLVAFCAAKRREWSAISPSVRSRRSR